MIDISTLAGLLPDYLARQAWFAHGAARAAAKRGTEPVVDVVIRRFEVWRDNGVGLVWAVADAVLNGRDVGAYQVLIGVRPAVPLPTFLVGASSRIVGTIVADGAESIAYDALVDPELTIAALEVMFDDLSSVRTVRKLTVGKTSTSVVADERWLCKVFRRVHDGVNPGVEMPETLWRHGFRATLETVESWRPGEVDLALRRPFLPGAANGFDFASASLRELLASGLDPDLSPGDFSAEARRLGQMVADMHAASAAAFGVEAIATRDHVSRLRDDIDHLDVNGLPAELVDEWVSHRCATLPAELPTLRGHGNLHLGQLLRSDFGWLILDFEGAPMTPVSQRRLPRPGWEDVGSILRSFDYVVAFTMASRAETEESRHESQRRAARWVDRNSKAFLDGYVRNVPANVIGDVDPPAAVSVGEVSRAAYEIAYERANRPENERIPTRALIDLVRDRGESRQS